MCKQQNLAQPNSIYLFHHILPRGSEVGGHTLRNHGRPIQLQIHPAGAHWHRHHRHCVDARTAQDTDRRARRLENLPYSFLLHAQGQFACLVKKNIPLCIVSQVCLFLGQIHPSYYRRKVGRHSRQLPTLRRDPPVLRGPHECIV